VADRVGATGSGRIDELVAFSLEFSVLPYSWGTSLGVNIGWVAHGTAGRDKFGMGLGEFGAQMANLFVDTASVASYFPLPYDKIEELIPVAI
jgi:hypothetical protein